MARDIQIYIFRKDNRIVIAMNPSREQLAVAVNDGWNCYPTELVWLDVPNVWKPTGEEISCVGQLMAEMN